MDFKRPMYPFWIYSEVFYQNQSHWHNWGKFSLRVAPSVSGATPRLGKVLIVLAIRSSSSSTWGRGQLKSIHSCGGTAKNCGVTEREGF